ncbi:ADP-ribosylglycohydrolase family protein [Cellulomonas wangsupingiae]|uniref:ADP-ribosylglycohydrolase family protein n=1 Tax=Cellulomonas wangsupingiae TaxID=2968085 RepID=UPI002030C8F8|nr:ADP-ribosylglycohydrolase family protein [Cellulomonas wangsupingiae]MCM0639536.1 ADP-ribosylglycohydrolase family protein [Cellulomonas wangsupingiae]
MTRPLPTLGAHMHLTPTHLDRIVAAWADWVRAVTDVGAQTSALLDALPTPTAVAAWEHAGAHYAANPRHAGGNGTLMRTGPVALGYLADGREAGLASAARAVPDPPGGLPKNGWVVQALQGAWSAIHHGDGLVDVLERAVRGGRDTDTVAAIAGALAGAAHGAGAVPDEWRRKLHGWPGIDADGLAELAVRAVDARAR